LQASQRSSLSGLDSSAHEFFQRVQQIFDDIADLRTLSRRRLWFLCSGEELELWLIKTAFGLYASGNIATVGENHIELNPSILTRKPWILLKYSCPDGSELCSRNNDSTPAGKLNHGCASNHKRDQTLREKIACGLFQ
jgi:hypothetical protein